MTREKAKLSDQVMIKKYRNGKLIEQRESKRSKWKKFIHYLIKFLLE